MLQPTGEPQPDSLHRQESEPSLTPGSILFYSFLYAELTSSWVTAAFLYSRDNNTYVIVHMGERGGPGPRQG